MNVLKIVACLLFFSFVWCVGYGDTPLKQKKEEQAKQAPVDGRTCYMMRSEMHG